jgi:hypothetical protein
MHLCRRGILKLSKTFYYETFVGIKQETAADKSLGVLLKLIRIHLQVLLHGSEINIQMIVDPSDRFVLNIVEPVNGVVHNATLE